MKGIFGILFSLLLILAAPDVVSASVDVQPLSVTRGASSVVAGGTLAVSWQIRNNGTGTAGTSNSQVRITNSSTSFGNSANNVGSAQATGSIAAGATINQSTSVTVPTSPGTYYVWVIADNTSRLTQSNTSNDFARSSAFTVTAPATPTPSVSSVSPTSMAADGVLRALTIAGSNFRAGNIVQFKWGVPPNHGEWRNATGTTKIISAGQITVNMQPGTVTDTIYVRVCKAAGATTSADCSSGTHAVTVTALPVESVAIAIQVQARSGIWVRSGPGTHYNAVNGVKHLQQYVAFQKVVSETESWYRIHLPCGPKGGAPGVCSGWVAGHDGATTHSIQRHDALLAEIYGAGLQGLNVRAYPGGSVLDSVYDGQRFVYFDSQPAGSGCNSAWHAIHVPALSNANSGWICGDFAVISNAASPNEPIIDDFSGTTLDATFWAGTAGNRVVQQDGILKIETSSTDNGGRIYSKPIVISSSLPITLTRRVKIHYQNNYFIGRMSFWLEDPSNGSRLDDGDLSVNYGHMSYRGGKWCPLDGFYLLDIGLQSQYAPDAHTVAEGHYCEFQSRSSSRVAPVWDAWFEERITYDPKSGLAEYFIDGTKKTQLQIGSPPANQQYHLVIRLDAWGWNTGHYQHVDDIRVAQTLPPASIKGSVFTANGQGLASVRVDMVGEEYRTATTNESGQFLIAGLTPGEYTITPNFLDHEFSPRDRSVNISGSDVDGVVFRACDPALPITGTVMDHTTGAPMASVAVTVDGANATVTGPDGAFSIGGLGCGVHEIGVDLTGRGYAEYLSSLDRFARSHLDIRLTRESTTNGIEGEFGVASDPVNTATGNYIYQSRDLELPGIGMPLRFDRAYNSREATNPGAAGAPLGYGWTHSYHVRLAEDAGGSVTITWGDGQTETFSPDGSGGYTPQYGVFDTLADSGDGTFSLEKRDRTVYDFDSTGRLSAVTDKNGNRIDLGYTGNDLTDLTDTAGRIVTLDYDASGRITQITDPIGRTVQFGYDTNGDLISAIDPNGNTTQYTYDDIHQILSVVDPRGHAFVNNTYDADRRVVTYQTDAKGGATNFEYQELDRITTVTDAEGNVLVHQHDELLRLVREVDARGGVALYEYDALGNRVQVTDKNGNITRYDYDNRGNVTRKTDALGNITAISYDADDNPLSRTDALGRVTEFSYDANGNLTQTTDALGNVSSITYLANGLPETVTDPNGNITTNVYDAEGNLTQVTDALGHVTRYSYDGVGRRLTETDALGRSTAFAYDGNDNLLRRTDALGKSITHTYDANDNQLSTTDRLGRTTSWIYDEKDLVIQETNPLGQAETYTYDGIDRRLTRSDRRGNTTEYGYDAVGNLAQVTDALGNVTTYAYDLNGNRVHSTDARGNAAGTSYDALNRVTQVRDALGNAVVTTYDALGRIDTINAPDGRITRHGYDALGRLTQTTDPAGGITRFGYDVNGNRTSRTDANGHITTTSYDALNRIAAVTDALGQTTRFTYDAVGNRVSTTDPLGHTSETTYDALNRPIGQTDALGHTSATSFDAEGNVLQTTDASGQVTRFGYDALDRLILVTDAAGGTVRYSYDENGNRLSMTDPNDNVTTYGYDALNRRTSMTEPLGHLTRLTYDATGNLIQKTDPKGQAIGYSYDAVNRRTGIDYPAESDASFTYDAMGNLLTMTDGLGTTTHAYDLLDRRTSTTDPFGRLVGYGYDAVGNRISLTYPGAKTVSYGYDAADRLTAVTDWLNNQTVYSYDGAGRLVGTVNANGTTTSYGYDAADRLTSLTNAKSDGTVINAYRYTLDPVGNHLSEERTEPLSPQLTHGTVTDTHDAENRLIRSNGIANSFDANGNMTAKGADIFAYDAADRLIATTIGGTQTQYQYDALGNRYSRTRAGQETRFVLDTNTALTNVLMETDRAGNALAYNVYGQGLISRVLSDVSVITYHYDLRGSTIATTDFTERVEQQYAYDPFGKVLNVGGIATNPFGFLGQHGVIDEQDDLSFIRARFYDTEQQRFVSKDLKLGSETYAQTLNRYIYALANPTMLIDVSGFDPKEVLSTGRLTEAERARLRAEQQAYLEEAAKANQRVKLLDRLIFGTTLVKAPADLTMAVASCFPTARGVTEFYAGANLVVDGVQAQASVLQGDTSAGIEFAARRTIEDVLLKGGAELLGGSLASCGMDIGLTVSHSINDIGEAWEDL